VAEEVAAKRPKLEEKPVVKLPTILPCFKKVKKTIEKKIVGEVPEEKE